jgi:hypothetical protein
VAYSLKNVTLTDLHFPPLLRCTVLTSVIPQRMSLAFYVSVFFTIRLVAEKSEENRFCILTKAYGVGVHLTGGVAG